MMESRSSFVVAVKNLNKCKNCGICEEIVPCQAGHVGNSSECSGCEACYLSCPNEAIELKGAERKREVAIWVDGEKFYVPERITVLKALEILGYKISRFPKKGHIFAPCRTGGCYSCAVEINGQTKPSCVTKVEENMRIITEPERNLRIVHGWMGHPVGGVGTPWWLKGKYYIEAAAFACGCNLRCPQCQNWSTTYCGKGKPLTPRKAAEIMTKTRRYYGVDRMAISGGECTLNRKWLLQYIRELRDLNRDRDARFHVDTNTTILTEDFIEELVESGMTDIGIDIKGIELETFIRITGIEDRDLAGEYLRTTWKAFRCLIEKYRDRVFIGIGIPFNRHLISMEEVIKIGEKVAEVDPEVQVCVLDYRPEFRRRDILRPSFKEMFEIWRSLKDLGLKNVICQTSRGYIGP